MITRQGGWHDGLPKKIIMLLTACLGAVKRRRKEASCSPRLRAYPVNLSRAFCSQSLNQKPRRMAGLALRAELGVATSTRRGGF
jgi:hypothetical protein